MVILFQNTMLFWMIKIKIQVYISEVTNKGVPTYRKDICVGFFLPKWNKRGRVMYQMLTLRSRKEEYPSFVRY